MSDCGVCIDMGMDADGYLETIQHEVVAADEPRKCQECQAEILVGQEFELYVGESEECGVCSFRTCLRCMEIRDIFVCGAAIPGELWESMEEQAFPDLTTANECFARLSLAAKAFTLDRWRKWKGLAA